MMKKTIPCTACSRPTTTNRVKVNLMIDKETNHIVTVSTRSQSCASCGHNGYTDKEMNRLRDLTAFYQIEARIEREKKEEEEEAETMKEDECEDEFEEDFEDQQEIA